MKLQTTFFSALILIVSCSQFCWSQKMTLRQAYHQGMKGSPQTEHLPLEELRYVTYDLDIEEFEGVSHVNLDFYVSPRKVSKWFRSHFSNDSIVGSVYSINYQDLAVGDIFPLPNGQLCRLESIDVKKKRVVIKRLSKKESPVKVEIKTDSFIIPISKQKMKPRVHEGKEYRRGRNASSVQYFFGVQVDDTGKRTRGHNNPIVQAKIYSGLLEKKYFPKSIIHRIYSTTTVPVQCTLTKGDILPVYDYGYLVIDVVAPDPKLKFTGWVELATTPIRLKSIRVESLMNKKPTRQPGKKSNQPTPIK